MTPDFAYDVALSFAGADREIAGTIARIAQAHGLRVFFDEHYVVRVWGRNLVEELSEIYATRARYCLILISEAYLRSAYTRIERRAALDRAIRERAEYILPVMVDGAWIPGLPRSTAYLDLRETPVEEVAAALVRKVCGPGAAVSTAAGAIEKIHPTEPPEVSWPRTGTTPAPLRFALVRLGAECKQWKEGDSPCAPGSGDDTIRRYSSWTLGEDPVFDVTLLTTADGPVLIDRVGVQFTRAGFLALLLGGAGGISEVHRRDVFVLELPDVWARMVDAPRRATSGGERGGPIEVSERAESRLPDPLMLDRGTAYRFALVLFDYAMLIPNEVQLRFFVGTDRGIVYSDEVGLSYVIGGDYAGLARVFGSGPHGGDVDVRSEAERLWRLAGEPEDRDLDIWLEAESRVQPERLRYTSLRPRPL